ncbi:hypothetical protein EVAR_64073_1 [Eumeta japonica]|uniref:Uncharacterized protein n=1 Tax=Eumeta variegata TaxID=151549 RepID=A0A4C1ZE56_EUMVA|nr:hypothetical protein EVAR_64073_1 [Eumeta japonica]
MKQVYSGNETIDNIGINIVNEIDSKRLSTGIRCRICRCKLYKCFKEKLKAKTSGKVFSYFQTEELNFERLEDADHHLRKCGGDVRNGLTCLAEHRTSNLIGRVKPPKNLLDKRTHTRFKRDVVHVRRKTTCIKLFEGAILKLSPDLTSAAALDLQENAEVNAELDGS